MQAPGLPTGTVTFLFTDIEGSTKLWQGQPAQMSAALARHDTVLRGIIERHGGRVFKTIGDAFCAAFATALDALEAALELQVGLAAETWDLARPVRVRAALHTGEAEERDNDYFGQTLNRVARLLSIGHGGQVLLSLVTAELVRDTLPDGVTLKEMGEQRLKDLTRPESVFQLMHASLPDTFPPLNSLDLHPHNLPTQLTPLIGREKELETVEKLLLDEGTRIVTLTGPGGMGKTRLGLQAAADLIEHFRHGVYFVDLASTADPGLIARAVARTLHIQETARRPLLEEIAEFMREKRVLLLLDNFEQLTAGAVVIADLLGTCPHLTFLVTSRESLSLRAEKVYSVPPLAMPPGRTRRAVSAKALSQYESVRLFIERALVVNQDFHVDDQNAPAVAEICVRLDGIPLAIELAAARVRILSPEEILQRLDRRLQLLTSGARDLPDRQRTLRATIDWSYELLDEASRGLLRALSVFAGGFTLESAEALCGALDGFCLEPLDGIESLLNRSLLVRDERPGGTPRVRMLETIREYVTEKLAADPARGRLRAAHARHFLALFERADFAGRGQKAWLERADAESENLRTALEWFAADGGQDGLARLGVALLPYWEIGCHLREGSEWLARVKLTDTALTAPLRTRVLVGRGVMARQRGEYGAAVEALNESLATLEGADDCAARARAGCELARTRYMMNELEHAAKQYRRAEDDAARCGTDVVWAECEVGLGSIDWRNSLSFDAQRHFQEARSVFAREGLQRLEAKVINNLGLLQSMAGNAEGSLALFIEALALQEEIGDWDDIRKVRNNIADTHYRLGQYDQSARAYESLLTYAESRGDARWESMAHAGLADVSLLLGRVDEAETHATDAAQAALSVGPGVELGIAYRLAGDVARMRGNWALAIQEYQKAIPPLEAAAEPSELGKATEGLEIARRDQDVKGAPGARQGETNG
jgi:predicted ATPase/class 3 adenylate cyclase